MEIIWEPKIALISFALLFFIVYLFYISGEKKYQKGTSQTVSYFSGAEPPKAIKTGNIYWGFLKDFEKLYEFLTKTQKENPNDYGFAFILGFVILFFLICLI
jgi:energy-coupling factor transporter transmembrane protein EcfT